MDLLKTDRVLYAYAKPCAGPGWCNTPIIVVVEDKEGVLKDRYIQPEEQTDVMRRIFNVSSELHSLMIDECKKLQEPKKRGAKK
jgi:hypothetical protein